MRKKWKILVPVTAVIICTAVFLSGGCGGGSSGGAYIPTGAQATADLVWSASRLMNEMSTNPNLFVFDCRKKVADSTGAMIVPYNEEHIEGSYYLDFFLFGDPYPDDVKVQQELSTLGITVNSKICLYDAGVANPQGKVFYQLERQGCKDVHILDGGFPVWQQVGGPTSKTATPAPPKSNFIPNIDDSIHAELADMKSVFDQINLGPPTNYTMVDYREEPLYDGHKICPDALRHGHIPMCNFLDWHDYFDTSTGLFKTQADISAMTTAAGCDITKTNVLLCNKGWRSGLAYFALRYAGWPKSSLVHYVGGIREWTWEDEVDYPMVTEGCYQVGQPLGNDWSSASKRWCGAFATVEFPAQATSKVYCISGYMLNPSPMGPNDYAVYSGKNQAYDIVNDSWEDWKEMPAARAFAVAAKDSNDYIYVMGGLDDTGTISKTVYRYDVHNDGWDDGLQEKELLVGRYSYAAAGIKDTLYICGGLIDTDTSKTINYSDMAYSYDIGTKNWTTLPNLPVRRRCHAMVSIGDVLYVLGGFYYDDSGAGSGVDLRDIWAMDTSKLPLEWKQKADLPMDIAGHAAAVANDKIYILGGWSMDGIKYDVMEYDPVTNTSRVMKKMGKPACIGWPRYWYFTGAHGDLVPSIGGYGGVPKNISTTPNSGFTHFNQTYVYDLTNNFDP